LKYEFYKKKVREERKIYEKDEEGRGDSGKEERMMREKGDKWF